MDGYLYFIIFLIILFLYVHINSQYKRSEDLEIYEIDFTTNTQLQEICNIKQPILFSYLSFYPEFMTEITLDNVISKYGSSDIQIKENTDYWRTSNNKEHEQTGSSVKYYEPVDSFILPFQSSYKFMGTDSKSLYFSENNHEFVKETGIFRFFYNFNQYLKPNFTANTKYDICIGSQNAETPLRYHTDSNKFLIVTEGYIHVKMCPYRYSKKLHLIKDYDNFEYRSPVNVWSPQHKYKMDVDNIQFLDFYVLAGNVLFVPAYWFYSIKYSNSPNNLVSVISYSTIMNIASVLPEWFRYYLQQTSVETKVGKKMDKKEYNDSILLPQEPDYNEYMNSREPRQELQELHNESVELHKSVESHNSIEPQQDHIIKNNDIIINNDDYSQETIEKTIKKLTKNKLKLKTNTHQKEITNAGIYEA